LSYEGYDTPPRLLDAAMRCSQARPGAARKSAPPGLGRYGCPTPSGRARSGTPRSAITPSGLLDAAMRCSQARPGATFAAAPLGQPIVIGPVVTTASLRRAGAGACHSPRRTSGTCPSEWEWRSRHPGDTGMGDGRWPEEAVRLGPVRLALLPIGAFRFEPGGRVIALVGQAERAPVNGNGGRGTQPLENLHRLAAGRDVRGRPPGPAHRDRPGRYAASRRTDG
jgi:hypothetical protein